MENLRDLPEKKKIDFAIASGKFAAADQRFKKAEEKFWKNKNIQKLLQEQENKK